MSKHFGVPGIGGSLGLCAVCDRSFAVECITGESVVSFRVPGIAPTLYAHKDCISTLENIRDNKDGDWTQLPEGPLRRCYAETSERLTEQRKAEGSDEHTKNSP